VGEIASLMERLGRDIPEFRRKQSLAYPIAGMLALIAMAVFSGVTKGSELLTRRTLCDRRGRGMSLIWVAGWLERWG
jgi:hypothetical protein